MDRPDPRWSQSVHTASHRIRLRALWKSRPVRWSLSSGLLLATGFAAGRLGAPALLSSGLYVLALVAGGRFFATEALEELIEEHRIDIELLMTVAAVVAGILGEWGEAATLAFLYSISEALESFTEERSRRAIEALFDLAPRIVTRIDPDGTEADIAIEQLQVRDRFLVRPGQNVATDGVVVEGFSAVNEAAITGESMPMEKSPGSRVYAGTTNAQGALVVEATASFADNTLSAIVRLVKEAQEQKGHGQRFMERFTRHYSPAVLAMGAGVMLVGGLATGEWARWAERSAIVLVAAAPCALVISIPVTYVAAIGNAARRGVLIKGGVYLEELAQVRAVALDKTGTLTRGEPRVTTVVPLTTISEDDALTIAAGIERSSEHPLARAIVSAARGRDLNLPAVSDFQTAPGAGARATIDGSVYVIGSPSYLTRLGIPVTSDIVTDLEASGATAVVLTRDREPLAVIGIADELRPGVAETLRDLRAFVDHLVMLTGDNPRTAQAIAEDLGLDEVLAGLSPSDKAAAINRLVERHQHAAMVGDGVNDAPALAAASVGIAMGTAGSDVALEAADVALMADDLTKLIDAFAIGRRTRRVVAQNIAMALVLLTVLIPAALAGLLSLPAAVLAHELSEIAVIANGTRLSR
ncbi:MAG TPA: heavy metal translocating P-type ATPase [Actinobacteria bacterium]|nr:putative cadmium-transporting ATPase [bacterium BMS3Bbin01]HDH25518.1 heavy metal translocating P-type ATPase [Actinomycetota bacterium]